MSGGLQDRGVTRREGGRNSPGDASLWGRQITAGGVEWLWGTPKSSKNTTSTFFNTVHLLPKDLSFEHGAPNLLLAPGAI